MFVIKHKNETRQRVFLSVNTGHVPVRTLRAFNQRRAETLPAAQLIKVKLSPKYNRGFICECIRVKTSFESIIMMKEAL